LLRETGQVAALGIGAAGGLLGSLLAPRPSPVAVAWRRGAAGEWRTVRLLGSLERHGWVVLHDLPVRSREPTLIIWPSARVGYS
jgi:hypothetical protein